MSKSKQREPISILSDKEISDISRQVDMKNSSTISPRKKKKLLNKLALSRELHTSIYLRALKEVLPIGLLLSSAAIDPQRRTSYITELIPNKNYLQMIFYHDFTLMHLSIDDEVVDSVALLSTYEVGARVYNAEGQLPQHLAAQKENDIFVRLLYSYSAYDFSAKNAQGNTPLDIAILNNNYETVKFLALKNAPETLSHIWDYNYPCDLDQRIIDILSSKR